MVGRLAIENFWAVIPAGGAGTRLWPLSRQDAPKFLRDLTGSGRSLLQETYDRLHVLAEDRFLVVTGAVHQEAVLEQLPQLDGCVLAEPTPRDSMAAIGLAAAVLELRDPDAIMGSFAADHVITRAKRFTEAVRTAVEVAREGWLVTLGITPTFPSSAYGYIHGAGQLEGHDGVCVVDQFVEKPSEKVAQGYLDDGGYRWNAGMFVAKPGVLLDLLAESDPGFAAALREIAALDLGSESGAARMHEIWSRLPKIAVDHAVAEPAASAGKVAMVPAHFGWDDVGDFDSLAQLLDAAMTVDSEGPTVLGDSALVRSIDSSGLVVPASGRTIAVIGLEDVVVVDTPDAVLVTSRARAQQVKQMVAGLKASQRDDLT
ncbi:mannose-1-phosphate guanylyltransferase [Nocardioides nematodiphilus]|uniref:mannose-1-phosphate guanylyltransferase n=1 Tax=Nocardioides nematodiphilus TaxID=2849669 RepID=UPI001CD9336D|nr:sugar phosphate nucleotidyltransferase [Nocardioides nematodiphilus]MCA1984056.1 NTP transferase domain-containing protein [Nocardioides nematodiphilus]